MEKKEESSRTKAAKPEPVDCEVARGIWIDGFGIAVSNDYIVLDGIIAPPRSDKPYVIGRLLFPPRMLELLAESMNKAVEQQKNLKPAKVVVGTETH